MSTISSASDEASDSLAHPTSCSFGWIAVLMAAASGDSKGTSTGIATRSCGGRVGSQMSRAGYQFIAQESRSLQKHVAISVCLFAQVLAGSFDQMEVTIALCLGKALMRTLVLQGEVKNGARVRWSRDLFSRVPFSTPCRCLSAAFTPTHLISNLHQTNSRFGSSDPSHVWDFPAATSNIAPAQQNAVSPMVMRIGHQARARHDHHRAFAFTSYDRA